MNTQLMEFFRDIRRAFQEVDPDARVGLSGTQAPRAGNGMDWWKMSKAFNFYHSYNTGWSEEMRRSFAKATGVQISPYNAGYWLEGRRLENRMFWCLLHDTTGISAWATPLFFYGDMTFSKSGLDTRDLLRELKSGIWDQFRALSRKQDRIAIHYSQASINAAELLDKVRVMSDHRSAWVRILHDLGLQFNFIAYQQVEDGILRSQEFSVLILPMSIALSPKEVDEITRFVRGGGTVIADAYCGLMDSLCRKKSRGLLDSLFGIDRTGRESGAPAGIQISSRVGVPGNKARLVIAEADLEPTTATPLATTENGRGKAIFMAKAGRGKAWLLNLDLTPYDTDRRFGALAEMALARIIAYTLRSARVSPAYPLTLESGRTFHGEIVRYDAGTIEYIGILSEYQADGKDEIMRLQLLRRRYVYDLRSSRKLGKTKTLRIPLAPGQCRLFALMRRSLKKPLLQLRGGGTRGKHVAFRIIVPDARKESPRVVHLSLIGPDGNPLPDYAANFTCRDDAVEGEFPLALNDPAGTWHLSAKDVTTGQVAEIEFTVK